MGAEQFDRRIIVFLTEAWPIRYVHIILSSYSSVEPNVYLNIIFIIYLSLVTVIYSLILAFLDTLHCGFVLSGSRQQSVVDGLVRISFLVNDLTGVFF